MPLRRLAFLFAFLLGGLTCGLSGPALAQDTEAWPLYDSTYVNDYAKLLPEDVEGRVVAALTALRNDTGVEATVLTLPTRGGFTPAPSIEAFATGLFNHWGIGDAGRNDGILIMVLREDREMRIELGSGYPRAFDREAQDIIDDVFLPAFRDEAYARGIEAGTRAVIAGIARPHAEGNAPPEAQRSRTGIIVGVVLSVLGFAVSALVVFWRRIRDRFTRCPQCGTRGIRSVRHTLSRATRSRKGEGQRITDCPHCGYHNVAPFVIPMVSTTSSSSSGSFGGGSSGGGGASGSW